MSEGGVWCAFTWDWNYTELVTFETEVDALRWALDNHGEAVLLPYGMPLSEARGSTHE